MVLYLDRHLSDQKLLIYKKSRKLPLIKHVSFRKILLFFASITFFFILTVSFYLFNYSLLPEPPKSLPKVKFQCKQNFNQQPNDHRALSFVNNRISSGHLKLDPKVLVFVETQYSSLGKLIAEILEASRIKFKLEVQGKNLPKITNLDEGKFAVIVFENFEKYLNMNRWNRDILDKYCRDYGAGIIGFLPNREDNFKSYQMKGFPLIIDTNVQIHDYHINPQSPVLRLTKTGTIYEGNLPDSSWTVFSFNHSTYQPVVQAFISEPLNLFYSNTSNITKNENLVSTIVLDRGLFDDIKRVIFANGFNVWIHKLLFLDAISYLSRGKLSLPFERYILIDIDDIFVGEQGTRMKPADVEALLKTQKRFKSMIPGFRFNLGFSGKFYHKGNPEEDKGDDMLIENSKEFWWFCHMWGHSQPHLYENITVLETQMRLNKEFANQHNIPSNLGYSVAPHHSGVYPVHEPLYEAWKNVWNVKVTTTEEYPHLRPARLRRGFIHRGIMVLPRRTCGLYTHTIFIDKFPGGRAKLDNSINGGELFYIFVYNPINVFMTHMSNYANNRLALYTFESVIRFVKCWTNIQLQTIPPIQLANKYFQYHPEESDPVWFNPCKDKRHSSLWSSNKSCKKFPDFLIIGPQKTGSTALYTFLAMHPSIQSNHPSLETFEEIQFFNGKNYYKGLDWYMSFYPSLNNSGKKIFLFEKSATYFDGDLVPMRAHSLLPDAKIISILISPIKRAYSWYHHTRAHGDVTALNYSFYDVITAIDKSPKPLRELRNRCLNPGWYAIHLEKWLNYYSPRKLVIVDGEELKLDPAQVVNRLQIFLEIEPFFDYRDHLKFDPKKGFFCQLTGKNETKCLGRSKGRIYPKLDEKSEKFLRTYYLSHNVALSKLFNRLHQTLPQWLKDELSFT